MRSTPGGDTILSKISPGVCLRPNQDSKFHCPVGREIAKVYLPNYIEPVSYMDTRAIRFLLCQRREGVADAPGHGLVLRRLDTRLPTVGRQGCCRSHLYGCTRDKARAARGDAGRARARMYLPLPLPLHLPPALRIRKNTPAPPQVPMVAARLGA